MLRDAVTTAAYQQGELHAENDKLRMLIKRLLRHRFGRRSEQLAADQLQFGLEDLEQTVAIYLCSVANALTIPPSICECLSARGWEPPIAKSLTRL